MRKNLFNSIRLAWPISAISHHNNRTLTGAAGVPGLGHPQGYGGVFPYPKAPRILFAMLDYSGLIWRLVRPVFAKGFKVGA